MVVPVLPCSCAILSGDLPHADLLHLQYYFVLSSNVKEEAFPPLGGAFFSLCSHVILVSF